MNVNLGDVSVFWEITHQVQGVFEHIVVCVIDSSKQQEASVDLMGIVNDVEVFFVCFFTLLLVLLLIDKLPEHVWFVCFIKSAAYRELLSWQI